MTSQSEIIFVRILLPLMAGMCFANTIYLWVNISVVLIGSTLLLLTLTLLNFRYRSLRIYRSKYLIGFFFSLFAFFYGILISLFNNESLRPTYFAQHNYTYLKVWVNDEPQENNGLIRFIAEVKTAYLSNQAIRANGKLLVMLKVDSTTHYPLNYGEELIISSKHFPVEPPYNPGEFDFKSWLSSKNIYSQAYVNQNHIIKTGRQAGRRLIKYAIDLRKEQVAIYRKIIKSDEAFAVASTLILGYRANLSKETLSAYSKTGTIHALSVSGMHVGMIYIVLNWMLSFLDRKLALRIIKIILICSLIWSYALLTGFSPSVLRSAIMLTVYILAKSFNKNTNGYNILAFTAFCLLLYDPFLIWDVGFQLSFLAVLGLIYLQPKIYKWFYFKYSWADYLWTSIALSLAAQIATFPLSIYYFHQFPVYFILSNLFILIPITLLMYLGIWILLSKMFFLAPLFEWMIIFMNNGLKWMADLPFAGITEIWLDKVQLILLSVSLALLLIALSIYHKKALFISFLFFITFQLLFTVNHLISLKQKKILFFTLQKNYATAFIEGQTSVLLTDLNINHKHFQFFIKPALEKMRVKKINLISWNIDTSLHSFIKKNHQINFHQYRILLIDSTFNYRRITNLPAFEMVWLHRNPKNTIHHLRQHVIFKSVVIDASTKDYYHKKYLKEANKLRIPTYVLKKNKAYLIDINALK